MKLRAAIAMCAIAMTMFGCKDQAKESAKKAAKDAADLAALIDKDVGEVQRGLPEGAKKLAPLYAAGADPTKDLQVVKQALLRAQRDVPDLNVAKSTFFALADTKGVGIRNNLDQDAMAGQDLVKFFPAISKAIAGEYVETTGSFGGPPLPGGPDHDWIAAMPVKDEANTVKALFVTGWSYRRFAIHLQEVLKTTLQAALLKSGDTGKLPVFYVAVFDSAGVYPERTTPKVDEQALIDAKLVEKTQNGPYEGTLKIEDTAFGYAAQRTPKLAADTGVVVMRSEL